MENIYQNISGLPEIPFNLLQKIRTKILQVYAATGEMQQSIDTIKLHTEKLSNQIIKSVQSAGISTFLNSSKQHQKFILVDDDKIKLALHIMPKGAEIPLHAHPGLFSMIFVSRGLLKVTYQSRFSRQKLSENNVIELTGRGETSLGLPELNNLHQISALSDQTTFFSLRVSKSEKNKQRFAMSIPKLLMSSMLISFAAYTVSKPTTVHALELNKTAMAKYSNDGITSRINRFNVEQFRNSELEEDQYSAAVWYKTRAERGDAEAQYWLGVMYLDGNGFTEDANLALKWVGAASDQGFKPAVKVLKYMLESNEALGC